MSGCLVLLWYGQFYGNVECRLDILLLGMVLILLGCDQVRVFVCSGCCWLVLFVYLVVIWVYQMVVVVVVEFDMVVYEVVGIYEVQVGELENCNDDEVVVEFNVIYSCWYCGELDVLLFGGEIVNDVLDCYLLVFVDLCMCYFDDGDWDGDIVVVSYSVVIWLVVVVFVGVDGNFVLDNYLENVELVVLVLIIDG